MTKPLFLQMLESAAADSGRAGCSPEDVDRLAEHRPLARGLALRRWTQLEAELLPP